MAGVLEGPPLPDEKTTFSMAEVLLKAPRTNLCAVRENLGTFN